MAPEPRGVPQTDRSHNDRELVVAFKSGDGHAYAMLYRQYRPVAEQICLRILGNADDAAEAAQETMLRVFQGLPRFNGRYLVRAWIARIATNVCLDILRKRTRRVDEVDSPEIDTPHEAQHLASVRQSVQDPSEISVRIDESRRVQGLLREMPVHHRDALVLREFEGWSHQEIGTALGMTPPQVKALIHRAKQNFKRGWTGTDGQTFGVAWLGFLWAPMRWLRRSAEQIPTTPSELHLALPQPLVTMATTAAPAASALSERLTAAVAAVAVAGGIGVGSLALPNDRRVTVRPAVAAQSQAPAPEVLASEAPAAAAQSPASVAPQQTGAAIAEPEVSPRRSLNPSPEPSESQQPVVADPTPTQEPTAPVAPDPTPPAPAWSMRFKADYSSNSLCECRISNVKTYDQGTTGTLGRDLRFGQDMEGAAQDAEGDSAWGLSLKFRGQTSGNSGTLNVDFTLMVGQDTYVYGARIAATEVRQVGSEWEYVFSGAYQLVGGPTGNAQPVGRGGTMTVRLKFWADGTLYRADYSLTS